MGGNVTSDNISPLHLMDVKRVAFETSPSRPWVRRRPRLPSRQREHSPAAKLSPRLLSKYSRRKLHRRQRLNRPNCQSLNRPNPKRPPIHKKLKSPNRKPSPSYAKQTCGRLQRKTKKFTSTPKPSSRPPPAIWAKSAKSSSKLIEVKLWLKQRVQFRRAFTRSRLI